MSDKFNKFVKGKELAMNISQIHHLKGELIIPGDKSISHRAVMFGSIANGLTEITHFLQGADCLATINCFRKMGIQIENKKELILIHGNGLRGLNTPSGILDVKNSGTTTRLIAGILAGQNFESTLTGDASLNSRPMGRIIAPLSQMGASIESIQNNGCAPLHIRGRQLHGIHYHSSVASAQIKSALLLAGLYANSETSVSEPTLSRNHTELMLRHFGASITVSQESATNYPTATVLPCNELSGQKINVPGDISSAAYFIAAGLLVPNSEILIKNVGTNPTRSGLLTICKNMGANITHINQHHINGEPVADLLVKTSALHGTTIDGDIIPTLIDEIPIIAILAAYAQGTTIIKDAAELKVKETNRIVTICENLNAMGAKVTPMEDGMIIEGGAPLHGTSINSHFDHRIAMAFTIAGLVADGITSIKESHCVDVSYPGFYETLNSLIK